MSRRKKLIITLITAAILLGLLAVPVLYHQLTYMPTDPLEFCIIEIRPADATRADTSATITVEVTNRSSVPIVMREARSMRMTFKEMEECLERPGGYRDMYLGHNLLSGEFSDIIVREHQTVRVDFQNAWMPFLPDTPGGLSIYYSWQTRVRNRMQRLITWLDKSLPDWVPLSSGGDWETPDDWTQHNAAPVTARDKVFPPSQNSTPE